MQRAIKVEASQEIQKAEYNRRKKKGVKTYNITVGMMVLKRNIRNDSRKGGKMEPIWSGPYK